MDFIRVAYKEDKKEDQASTKAFYPSLQAMESTDLVIRGGQFMAIWDEDTGLYCRKLSHVPEIVDKSFAKMVGNRLGPGDTIRKVRVFDNGIYSRLMGLIRNIGDMGPELDQKIVFANETPTKEDAATFQMAYSLTEGPTPAWDEIVSTLYTPQERLKIEWAIGSIFSGDSKNIQKFYVFFGPPGSGKSTIMNIIEMLFAGHTAAFSAYEMGRADSNFSLEPFARNPLVAIDQDGDLSRIEVNKNLNSIVSHDRVLINAKGKSLYEVYPRSTLFVGSNSPVKITDRKSGIFRRLVDIQPTGNTIPEAKYHQLMSQVRFELGALASHCLSIYKLHGPTYLSSYRPTDMMYRTNDIFNFVQDNRLILQQGATVKQAFKLYNEWCEETDTRNVYRQFEFRDKLADYYEEFHEQIMLDGHRLRSYFCGLRELEQFSWESLTPENKVPAWLEMTEADSLLDAELAEMPAQYSTGDPSHPLKKAWDDCTTTLKELDTTKEHYVKVPVNRIVVDFDLTDEDGNKSLEKSLEAAALWPETYAEPSRSGNGLHLHYDFDGPVEKLSTHKGPGIEIKTLLGNASLRRRRSRNNGLPPATINTGLPFKEEKVLSAKTMASERGLRELILRGLRKEVHPYTKPSMDFIEKVLNDAYSQGMVYDVGDMYEDILSFAMTSSNQRDACLEAVLRMKLKSDDEIPAEDVAGDKPIAIYDCEVLPNFFAIGWMYEEGDSVVKLVNPSPAEVEELLLNLRLIGFNNRGYDAHILHARTLGYDNAALYELSRKLIVERDRNATFGAAYNQDYADILDFAAQKKSLKKWEIELGLPHMEMDHPWDEPIPEERVPDLLDYLENDVRSQREVFWHLKADFDARLILAELSGKQPINTNRQHTETLIFGDLKDTSGVLEYTDLREMFPGYEFDQFKAGKDKSTYKGYSVGEGGFVYAEPGIYEDVVLLDVASMHPTSIVEMNLFGKYTQNFKDLLDVRLNIKKGDLEAAGELFGGRLKPYLESDAGALSDALKIVINSVYGLTAASFPNKFRDSRNVDNIVAKRGALFMVDLKEFIESRGFKVAHIKTDSVKIPGATPELIQEVFDFGKRYGYDFEHEATYSKFCLVNDAVYIAKVGWAQKAKKIGTWEAVGAQFQHPVVYKALFSGESVEPKDFVEVKQATKGAMYLVDPQTGYQQFVGRFGAFVPVTNGRELLRIDGDKSSAVGGTKGYLWEIDEFVVGDQAIEFEIDMSYFDELVSAAQRKIEEFGSYAEFVK